MRLRCFARRLALERPTRRQLARAARSRRVWAAGALSLGLAASAHAAVSPERRAAATCGLARGRAWAAAHVPALARLGDFAPAGWSCTPSGGRSEVPNAATLRVRSAPPGATVEIGGRARGRTPVDLQLVPGENDIAPRLPGFLDSASRAAVGAGETTPVSVELWRAAPPVVRVQPAPPAKSTAKAVLWDAPHARTLLAVARPAGIGASPSADSPPEFWLLRTGGAGPAGQGAGR
jgi:hypothetical protein